MLGAAIAIKIPATVSVVISSIKVKPFVLTKGIFNPTNGDLTGFFWQMNGNLEQMKGIRLE